MKRKVFEAMMNLQLFAEGEGAGSGSSGDGAGAGEGSGTGSGDGGAGGNGSLSFDDFLNERVVGKWRILREIPFSTLLSKVKRERPCTTPCLFKAHLPTAHSLGSRWKRS